MPDIPEGMVITMQDIRDAGYCVAGARRWFIANSLDFRAFLVSGMAATEFVAIDGLSADVVRKKLANG